MNIKSKARHDVTNRRLDPQTKTMKGKRAIASDAYAQHYKLAIEERQIQEEDKMRLLSEIRCSRDLVASPAYAAHESFYAHTQTFDVGKARRRVPSLFQLSLATAAGLVLVLGLSLLLLLKPSGPFNPRPQPQANIPLTPQVSEKKAKADKQGGAEKAGDNQDKSGALTSRNIVDSDQQGKTQGPGLAANQSPSGPKKPIALEPERATGDEVTPEGNTDKQPQASVMSQTLPSQQVTPGDKVAQGQHAPSLQLPGSSYELSHLGVIQLNLVNSVQAIQYANDILVTRYNDQTNNWDVVAPLIQDLIYDEVLYTLKAGETRTLDIDLSLYINQPGLYQLVLVYNLADDLSGPFNAYSASFEVR